MNPDMLSFDEAYEKLLGFVRPVREVEEVDTLFAAGRVLAVDQHSTIDQPPMDNSGMDGYALRAADVPVAGTRLPVSQRIPAGSVGHELAPGTAARIFTGCAAAAGCGHRGDAGAVRARRRRGAHWSQAIKTPRTERQARRATHARGNRPRPVSGAFGRGAGAFGAMIEAITAWASEWTHWAASFFN